MAHTTTSYEPLTAAVCEALRALGHARVASALLDLAARGLTVEVALVPTPAGPQLYVLIVCDAGDLADAERAALAGSVLAYWPRPGALVEAPLRLHVAEHCGCGAHRPSWHWTITQAGS